jgi:hypothetical protein
MTFMSTSVFIRSKGPGAISVKRPQNKPYSEPRLLATLMPDEEREFTVESLNDLLIEAAEL